MTEHQCLLWLLSRLQKLIRSLPVHQSLVPESKLKEGNMVAIRCAHWDTVLYPLERGAMD